MSISKYTLKFISLLKSILNKQKLLSIMENPENILSTDDIIKDEAKSQNLQSNKYSKKRQIYDNKDNRNLKKAKEDDEFHSRKKKVALLMVYSGKGYFGMQRNPGLKTIESDLLAALEKAGVVRPEHVDQPGAKMGFQRAARTDKGVSAAGQVVSLKMFVDIENALEKINEHLPDQIRVLGTIKTTKGFDCKNSCSSRIYIYMTPTFAFAPIDQLVNEEYRITEEILNRIQDILNNFKGTHNFHNFTSGKKPTDPSAQRYILSFTVGKPFVNNGIEFVILTVKGQSFMMHQIRKMAGITMAIARGYTGIEILAKCWKSEKVDIPKAPGLGLVLERLNYDRYNQKFGSDGLHDTLDWDKYQTEIDKFKEEYIFPSIYNCEKEEKSMLNWLSTLPLHHYDTHIGVLSEHSPIAMIQKNLDNDEMNMISNSEIKLKQLNTFTEFSIKNENNQLSNSVNNINESIIIGPNVDKHL